MSFQFILSFKGHVAPGLAQLIWAQKMGPSKVGLKALVVSVVNVFVILTTQVASQVLSAQVVEEFLIIEEVFLTKITPRMRQYFCLLVVSWVSILYVSSQMFNVINPLFSYEY